MICFLILCRDSKIPAPPPGHKWKEVRHDNKVTWLVSWTENIQGSIKYIMLNPSSRIKVKMQLKKQNQSNLLGRVSERQM